MRGRKPKPLARQVAEGDPRKIGKKKLLMMLENEPAVARGLPPCPRHLKGRARFAWNLWAAELAAVKLDRRPDAMMLEGACINWARSVKAHLILERDGEVIEISNVDKESGERYILKSQVNPWLTVFRTCQRLMFSFCSEFGLSPVSLTRLAVEKDDAPGLELAALLSKPREPRATVQ